MYKKQGICFHQLVNFFCLLKIQIINANYSRYQFFELKIQFQFVAFEIGIMQRIQQSHKQIPFKRKTPSLKSVDNTRKSKNNNKNNEGHKKIPQIINQLQQNIKLLKKCYNEEHSPQPFNLKCASRRPNRPLSSNTKCKSKTNQNNFQDQTASLAEIDDLKKSFLSMHGYETNNIVELYNFYKKNLEKSTRLFGSTSMSNMINLTQNHSEIRDKGVRPSTGLLLSTQQLTKQKQGSKNQTNIFPIIQNTRKPNQMVSVATLLADKKKISRKNICQNMNCDNLVIQAKKKLYRPNPNENIQKFNKLKQNYRNQNIRISPSRKIKNNEINKQKSSQKAKRTPKVENFNKIIQQKQILKSLQKLSAKKLIEKQEQNQQNIVIINVNTVEQSINKINLDKVKNIEKQRQANQMKQLKSAKSSKSVKSIKSPNSIRSPSLNQAIILDITGSCQPSQRKKFHQPSYFVPRVHSNPHDSLLDCEITPKQQSKILDLQSIPFDF